MSICDDLPVLECDVPKEGIELDLVLQPREPVNGEPQYWPLYNADNPGEHFGNMHFKITGKGVVTLKVTLDLSAVPSRDLEFAHCSRGNLDGIVALTPDFRHQFKSRTGLVDGEFTKLVIKIRDKEHIPDNFSFLWICEETETGMHFVSGDPKVAVQPE